MIQKSGIDIFDTMTHEEGSVTFMSMFPKVETSSARFVCERSRDISLFSPKKRFALGVCVVGRPPLLDVKWLFGRKSWGLTTFLAMSAAVFRRPPAPSVVRDSFRPSHCYRHGRLTLKKP